MSGNVSAEVAATPATASATETLAMPANTELTGATVTDAITAHAATLPETPVADSPIVPLTPTVEPTAEGLAAKAKADADKAKAEAKAKLDALYATVREALAKLEDLGDRDALTLYRDTFASVAGNMLARPNFKTLTGAQGDTDSAKLIRKTALETVKNHNHPYSGAIKMLSTYWLKRFEADVKTKANIRQLKSGAVSVRETRAVTVKENRDKFVPFSVSV